MNLHQPQKYLEIGERLRDNTKLRIGVIGLGHVGTVTAAAMLRDGHHVVGVECDERILANASVGRSSFREPQVDALIGQGHASGRFSVTNETGEIVNSDLVFLCVGTRGLPNGDLDLSEVVIAVKALGEAIHLRRDDLKPLLLVVRSTMLPGSMSDVVMPALLSSADEAPGSRYDVAYLPEFSREGSALADHFDASRIVIGEHRPGCGQLLLRLFENSDVEKFMTTFEVAELAKFADNSFHALKVAFANEIARFAVRAKATPRQVFDIFLADKKLNISPAYLRPGMAFGGPCLPKDVRALALRMEATGVAAPLMDSILRSNDSHLLFLIEEIEARVLPGARILLVGLSFKSATDDIRNSPLVNLSNELLDRGHNLNIYDPDFICDRDTDLCTIKSRLPANVAHRLLGEIYLSEHWDLVVAAKPIANLQGRLSPLVPTFRIDRFE